MGPKDEQGGESSGLDMFAIPCGHKSRAYAADSAFCSWELLLPSSVGKEKRVVFQYVLGNMVDLGHGPIPAPTSFLYSVPRIPRMPLPYVSKY